MRTLCILVLLQACLFLSIDSTKEKGEKFKKLEQKINGIEQKVAGIEENIQEINGRIGDVEEYAEGQRKIDRQDLEKKLSKLEKTVGELTNQVKALSSSSR